jgi:hypothetical protein
LVPGREGGGSGGEQERHEVSRRWRDGRFQRGGCWIATRIPSRLDIFLSIFYKTKDMELFTDSDGDAPTCGPSRSSGAKEQIVLQNRIVTDSSANGVYFLLLFYRVIELQIFNSGCYSESRLAHSFEGLSYCLLYVN